MKNYFIFITLIILLFLPVILYSKIIIDYEEIKTEFESEIKIKNQKIEELEKEIRILKTDIDIFWYGFESDIEELKNENQ